MVDLSLRHAVASDRVPYTGSGPCARQADPAADWLLLPGRVRVHHRGFGGIRRLDDQQEPPGRFMPTRRE
jgi:hypothetical protein